jgi:hypothetical protein
MGNRRRLSLERVKKALAKHDRAIQRAFETAIRERQESINLAALAQAIEGRDFNRAIEIAGLTGADMFPFRQAMQEAYVDGGRTITAAAPAFAARVALDGNAPRAVAWAQGHVGGLITEIVEDQRNAIRQIITEQVSVGRGPRDAARAVRGQIGLTTQQAGYVNGRTRPDGTFVPGARQQLETLDAGYFSRELRDKRFDGLVRRAIAEGKPLARADIERITGRYSERLLKHRAEVIARTESITALRAGRREGIAQSIEQGAIRADSLKRAWDATGDARTRPDHVAMNGTRVEGMDTPYVLPDGSRMRYPGDSGLGASAKQTILCRCWENFEVDWLSA